MDDEDVARMAERELGTTPANISAVPEGLLQETYVLEYDDDAFVLQVATDDRRSAELRRGTGVYRLLERSEIPVPRVVTEQVREYDGATYTVVEKLQGESAKDDISPGRVAAASEYLARIHDIREFDTTGWLRFEEGSVSVRPFEQGSQKERSRHRIAHYATLMRDRGMERAGTAITAFADRLDAGLPETDQPVLCHNDYSPGNVLYRDSSVTGVLDFDRAIAGDRRRDAVKAANAFWMHDPCADWGIRETFYEEYGMESSYAPAFEACEPFYRVETLTEMVGGMIELGELSDYEREFYTERLLEAIDRVDA